MPKKYIVRLAEAEGNTSKDSFTKVRFKPATALRPHPAQSQFQRRRMD